MPDLISLPRYVVSRGHPAIFFLDACLRGCVIIHNRVLRGTIFRAKALGYIDKNLILYNLSISTCLTGCVAQGFNPAKAGCDTAPFAGMTFLGMVNCHISNRLYITELG